MLILSCSVNNNDAVRSVGFSQSRTKTYVDEKEMDNNAFGQRINVCLSARR